MQTFFSYQNLRNFEEKNLKQSDQASFNHCLLYNVKMTLVQFNCLKIQAFYSNSDKLKMLWKWSTYYFVFCIIMHYSLGEYVMRSRDISQNSNMWHFQFSIWLKCSFGEVHFAVNSTWISPVVPRLWDIEGFSEQ